MPDDTHYKKQQNRTEELKFITQQLTPENPQDVYYRNYEETYKIYLFLVLIGLLMVGYMMFI